MDIYYRLFNNIQNYLVSFVKLTKMSMRSIKLSHAKRLYNEGYSVGTVLNKTSRAFLFGMLGEEEDQIYLQRGYRQYGEMQIDTYSESYYHIIIL